ncbi:MAG: hypothetical protein LC127_18010 [Chitinophagales bacterium]|nr:hypothetical protein [Chitinophagales bacterium]
MGTAEEKNSNNIIRLQTEMQNVQKEISEIKKEQAEGFDKVLTKIDDLDRRYVKREIYKKDMENIQCYLEDNKDNKKWLWRTVGAVIISSIIASLISAMVRGISI